MGVCLRFQVAEGTLQSTDHKHSTKELEVRTHCSIKLVRGVDARICCSFSPRKKNS